jgi:hypothetical protein
MKKIKILCVFILIVMLPVLSSAAYRIELKNGLSFITEIYWEDGDLLNYRYLGGIVGINKNMVKSITETELSVPKEILTDPPPEEISMESSAEAEEDQVKDSLESERPLVLIREDLQQNLDENDKYAADYSQAREQNNKAAMVKARERLAEIQKEKGQLKREVQNQLGDDWEEWWNDVTSQ